MKLICRTASFWAVLAMAALGGETPVAPVTATSASPMTVGQPTEIKADSSATITTYQHQSVCVDTPWPVKRVSVTDAQIADVQLLTPRQVLIMGKAVGTTDLLLWDEKDNAKQMRIHVAVNLDYLRVELKRVFPTMPLEVSQSANVLLVKGTLNRVEATAELTRYLDGLGVKYVNMTSVGGVQQVLLHVRVAEVSRTAIRNLGINFFQASSSFFGGSTVGPSSGGAINPVSIGVQKSVGVGPHMPFVFTQDASVSPSVTLFGGMPKAELQVFIQALAENQYLRLLAEPNLVALSGEEANFLAGGEYPIPVVQGSSAGGGTSITIEYKQFGAQLKFRPTVLGDGTIRLYAAPEVSELSDVGAVVIEGFRIPSVVTRRAESTVELKSGQTFAMAGLISRSSNATSSNVPLLGDLPVLGALFRSTRYQAGETELVVLVTATLVEPMSLAAPPPVPGLLHVEPNDWELYVCGQVQGHGPAKVSASEAAYLKSLGFDQLKGPGSWEVCEQGAARSAATQRPASPAPGQPTGSVAPPPDAAAK